MTYVVASQSKKIKTGVIQLY